MFQPPLCQSAGALERAAVLVRCWWDMADLLRLAITNDCVANDCVGMIRLRRSQVPVRLEGQ